MLNVIEVYFELVHPIREASWMSLLVAIQIRHGLWSGSEVETYLILILYLVCAYD